MDARAPLRRSLRLVLALSAPLYAAACGEVPHAADLGDEPLRGAAERVDIPVVDQGHPGQMTGQPAGQAAPSAAQAPGAQAAAPPASAASAQAGGGAQALMGSDADRAVVRGYMQKLMDVTRVVPATAARSGGPRGSPGSFAKLSSEQVEEFVSAIIYGAELFMPKSLKKEEKWALIACEISIESAFVPGTRGVNPGDSSKVSVSPLQITGRGNPQGPGMWEDTFAQYANLPGLLHYDGSPWNTKATGADQLAQLADRLEHSIFDGIIAALWCITEQGRRGIPDWFGGPDGPMPKTWRNAQLAWVIGGPALISGGDLAGQRDAYIASEITDLTLLGLPASLLESTF